MPESRPLPDPHDTKTEVAQDVIVAIWALTFIAGLFEHVQALIRRARGEMEVNISAAGGFAFSIGLARLALRLSSRMRREYALGQTVTRLHTTVDDLERVVRAGAEEAMKREERSSAREERMAASAESTLKVARWTLAVAIVTLAATIGAVILAA
jgi:hypothetical protein